MSECVKGRNLYPAFSRGQARGRAPLHSFTPSHSLLGIVQRPIIVQEADFRFLFADEVLVLGLAGEQRRIAGEETLERGVAFPALSEVAAVPGRGVENFRYFQDARLRVEAIARTIRKETRRLLFELLFDPVGDV